MACPQTEQEILAYFWSKIGKQPGQNANDFEQVLAAAYDWNGTPTIFPRDVPTQGEQLPSDSPFYGITIQAGADEIPAGRIWIPAAEPDGNNYYTRYFQVIKDKPGGVHGKDFLWDMRYLAGNEYVPICDDNGGTVPPNPNPPTDCECCKVLEQQLSDLAGRVLVLEQKQNSKRVALIADNGKYVTAEVGQNPPILSARGDNPDAWQQFTVQELE